MTQERIKIWLSHKYPLTIIADRYSGTYSGGIFTAWPCRPQEIHDGAISSDPDCALFWSLNNSNINFCVGRGSTPAKAIGDLTKRIKIRLKSLTE